MTCNLSEEPEDTLEYWKSMCMELSDDLGTHAEIYKELELEMEKRDDMLKEKDLINKKISLEFQQYKVSKTKCTGIYLGD